MNFRLLLVILLLPGFASAQFLPANTPLQQAFIQATQEDKLIFVVVESASCQQCNDVADKGLQQEPVQRQLKDHFVALRISPFHPDLNYVKEKYNYNTDVNIVLFLDKWGTLVHRMNMSTTFATKYLQEMAVATTRKAEAYQVRSLEQTALAGRMDPDKLYELMQSRKLLSLPTDDLLNQYVSQLPADSLQSLTTLERIYRMSPILHSNADQVLHQNQPLFAALRLNISGNDQAAIKQQIIFKSRQQAIREKQIGKAIVVADFARAECTGNKTAADRAYHYNMMEYYQGIHDTAAYLNAAVNYYEQFTMRINAAYIKKQDSTRFATLGKQEGRKDTIHGPGATTVITNKRLFSPTAPRYQQELSYAARTFYNMTNDITYLRKALQWAAHANDFYESAYGLDTYARLLYKVNKSVDQAVQLEEKAIGLMTQQGFSAAAFHMVLSKMKKGETNID